MENEKQDKKQNNINWGFIAVGLFIITLLSILFRKFFPKKPKTYSKSDLVKLYEVDIKTINKWVEVFCDPNILPYEVYKRKRKLSEDIYNHIIESLGLPTDETPVMSKFQIITNGEDMLGDEYRGARNSLKLEPHSDTINHNVYAIFNLFPPKIAQLLQKKVA
jgi:hypothetical protein